MSLWSQKRWKEKKERKKEIPHLVDLETLESRTIWHTWSQGINAAALENSIQNKRKKYSGFLIPLILHCPAVDFIGNSQEPGRKECTVLLGTVTLRMKGHDRSELESK